MYEVCTPRGSRTSDVGRQKSKKKKRRKEERKVKKKKKKKKGCRLKRANVRRFGGCDTHSARLARRSPTCHIFLFYFFIPFFFLSSFSSRHPKPTRKGEIRDWIWLAGKKEEEEGKSAKA